MGDYILKRAASSVLVLLVLAAGSFFVIHLVPVTRSGRCWAAVRRRNPSNGRGESSDWNDHSPSSSPVLSSRPSPAILASLSRCQTPISTLIGHRVIPSVILILYGVLIALVTGVPLAVISALRPQSLADNTVLVTTTFAFAMPQFWLGLVLALLFGLYLKIFPVSGYEGGIGGVLRTPTLPALTLGLSMTAMVVRTLRTRLLDVLGSEYIEAARARGPERDPGRLQARDAQCVHGDADRACRCRSAS